VPSNESRQLGRKCDEKTTCQVRIVHIKGTYQIFVFVKKDVTMRKLEWLEEQNAQRRMHGNRYESRRATVLEIDTYSDREGNIRQPYEDRTCSSSG
jgi:hypothetical protein